jgi:hypothetical protein
MKESKGEQITFAIMLVVLGYGLFYIGGESERNRMRELAVEYGCAHWSEEPGGRLIFNWGHLGEDNR